MIWNVLPTFDHLSWGGQYACAVCGSGDRPSVEKIFRPPVVDDFDGSFDVCEHCIREAARELGISETAGFEHANETLTKQVVKLQEELEQARDAQASLARENVRLQDIIEEHNTDELYGLVPEEDDE